MGGQRKGQMVDFVTLPGQQPGPNAMTAAETNRNDGISSREATGKGLSESHPIRHASEEQRRDLYRL